MLLLKILLVPTIIYLISLAGRVFGPALSGLLGGLPVIAGPILLFLYFDRGAEFATNATLGALASVSSLAIFCLSYGHSSRMLKPSAALLTSVSAFLLVTAVFTAWKPNSNSALSLALISIGLGLFFMPPVRVPKVPYSVPNTEIIFRMIAAAVLVLTITGISGLIGPRLSGLLAPFPIAGTVLAGFTHHHYGHEATVGLLKGFLRGLVGMAIFDYVLIWQNEPLGFEVAFLVAIVCALIAGTSISKAWMACSTRCVE